MLATAALAFLAGVFSVHAAEANGGKGKVITYEARLSLESGGRVRVTSTLDDRLFLLTTLRNKYKVLRVKIDNTQNPNTIPLSKTADRIDVVSRDPRTAAEIRIPGILDLGERDPQLWDSLDADARKTLAYPTTVPPREEESIFVFIPDGALTTSPKELTYTIEGLSGTVVRLREPPVAKR
jgi:hypothetical protein